MHAGAVVTNYFSGAHLLVYSVSVVFPGPSHVNCQQLRERYFSTWLDHGAGNPIVDLSIL